MYDDDYMMKLYVKFPMPAYRVLIGSYFKFC